MFLPPKMWRKKSGSRLTAVAVASADRPSFEDWFFAQKLQATGLV